MIYYTSTELMGIKRDFSGTIKGKVDNPQEVLTKGKVSKLEKQTKDAMESYVKADNTKLDLIPEAGKFGNVIRRKDGINVSQYAVFCPETKKPISFEATAEDNSVNLKASWDDSGNLASVNSTRKFGNKTEAVNFSTTYENGEKIIKFEEQVMIIADEK